MSGQVTVVVGTGTEVGKTHICEALLTHLRERGVRAAGFKPVESGFIDGASDADRLARSSMFHVKQTGIRLAAPISPHLAARREGMRVSLERAAEATRAIQADCEALVVELPGGLYTPLTDSAFNADLVKVIAPRHLVLVAADRLGVLHDVICAFRAAQSDGLSISAVAVNAPAYPDASTGTNALELHMFLKPTTIVQASRCTPKQLAASPAIGQLAELIAR